VAIYLVTFGYIIVAAYKMGMVHEKPRVVRAGALGVGAMKAWNRNLEARTVAGGARRNAGFGNGPAMAPAMAPARSENYAGAAKRMVICPILMRSILLTRLKHGCNDYRMRVCGIGHRHLSGQHRPYCARRGKRPAQAQDADGRTCPIFEPGLQELMQELYAAGQLQFTDNIAAAVKDAQVGVPLRWDAAESGRHGGHELS